MDSFFGEAPSSIELHTSPENNFDDLHALCLVGQPDRRSPEKHENKYTGHLKNDTMCPPKCHNHGSLRLYNPTYILVLGNSMATHIVGAALQLGTSLVEDLRQSEMFGSKTTTSTV